jgi:hypothetical protein
LAATAVRWIGHIAILTVAAANSAAQDAPGIAPKGREKSNLFALHNDSADEALRGRCSAGRPSIDREEAARWLQKMPADGLKGTSIIENKAVAHGFHLRTLRRAFRDLGGEAFRLGGPGPLGHWFWKLPG